MVFFLHGLRSDPLHAPVSRCCTKQIRHWRKTPSLRSALFSSLLCLDFDLSSFRHAVWSHHRSGRCSRFTAGKSARLSSLQIVKNGAFRWFDRRMLCFSFSDVWLTRLLHHNGLAVWASVLFFETCLSVIIGLTRSDLVSATSACLIGCSIYLLGILILSIVENVIFPSALAFTLSPWFIFLWLLGGIVFGRPNDATAPILVFWFIRFLFALTCVLALIRWILFFWRYKEKSIPTFQPPRIYSLISEPRHFWTSHVFLTLTAIFLLLVLYSLLSSLSLFLNWWLDLSSLIYLKRFFQFFCLNKTMFWSFIFFFICNCVNWNKRTTRLWPSFRFL